MINIRKLDSELWESADLLRSGSKLTSNQYCMPVLGLIFLRSCENAGRLPFGLPSVNKNKEVSNANYLWISYFYSYLNEQALRYVIKFAYIVCIDYYLKVEELPAGKGIADVVFIPKRDTALPAMIVELKWNETAESAIEQNKKYPLLLENYVGEMVLAGINYNEKTKEYSCRIKRIDV